MLPAEFKTGEYRFSFRRHGADMKSHVYAGSKMVDGVYVSLGEIAVKPSTTKKQLHSMFIAMGRVYP